MTLVTMVEEPTLQGRKVCCIRKTGNEEHMRVCWWGDIELCFEAYDRNLSKFVRNI
jgi:hypothetical protein